MGLLDILKAAMGLGSSRSQRTSGTTDASRQDVDVTVEHEPDTESEDAVKGTGKAGTESEAEPAADVQDEDTEADTEEEADETAAEDAPDVQGADESVDTVNGIGPSYAERLGEAGVETVGDLVASDAAELAEETDISEKRIQGWIDKASE
jgi:predicted flap endonuclease-1-like 5' DNA nuclease